MYCPGFACASTLFSLLNWQLSLLLHGGTGHHSARAPNPFCTAFPRWRRDLSTAGTTEKSLHNINKVTFHFRNYSSILITGRKMPGSKMKAGKDGKGHRPKKVEVHLFHNVILYHEHFWASCVGNYPCAV